jgi:hypothetical protein
MGSAFECQCKACGHLFKVLQGGGFRFVHVCCDGCGQTKSLPRFSPRTRRPPKEIPWFLWRQDDEVEQRGEPEDAVSRALETLSVQQIKDYLDAKPWAKDGDPWTPDEQRILFDCLGECSCGGRWVSPDLAGVNKPHALHRCPHCRSRCFAYRLPDIAFD